MEQMEKIPLPTKIGRQFTEGNITAEISQLIASQSVKPLDVIMVGTGEYTTGYVHGVASNSDKSAGVVALTMFDLRSRGKVGSLGLCGVNGTKFPGIRNHLKAAIASTYSCLDISLETFPSDSEIDAKSYVNAFDKCKRGDVATIFTPDDTHFEIALAAINRGLHVLVTKPIVKTLEEHRILNEAADRNNVLVAIEVHKRWDPMYADARDRIQNLGSFSYLYSYMSQPKHQLDTFRSWAGKSSDISYYLNSHHIDFHEWTVGETSRPIKVTATASTGVAREKFSIDTEDTITLTVQWENVEVMRGEGVLDIEVTAKSLGTAVYTSSWIAPKSDVHSQQRFFYMGQGGEVSIDQAHRGYQMADDQSGYRSVNPLFMKYTPSNGKFAGQQGYGYRSFEAFIDAAQSINDGKATVADFEHSLATIGTTFRTTAILEAGRLSLDSGKSFEIVYESLTSPFVPTAIKPI